jgi:hypothetical protein
MHTHIDRVHVIFKTHLDVGFTDYAHLVTEQYMTRFIPGAIALAETMRRDHPDEPFCWTVGAWLIYEYFERAAPDQRRRLEQAVSDNLVTWHAAPFTTHTELMDAGLLRYGLSLSQKLDVRFGRRTIAAKMTDVPGHTRALIPLFSEAGIRFFHVGVNPASTVPDVPPVFIWRDDASSTELLMMYQHGYGDVMILPGTREAVALVMTGDNLGPPSVDGVRQTYADLRRTFPNAALVGSTLNAAAECLAHTGTPLPVITDEIGDSWIHGTATDPTKVNQYRALLRLRDRWLAAGRIDAAHLDRFHHALLMIAEHTWGMDLKTHLGDYTHYDTQALAHMRHSDPQFRRFEASWDEQRAYLDQALTALDGTPLRAEADQHLRAIAPQRTDRAGYRPLSAAQFETAHWHVGIDCETGALNLLTTRLGGVRWADESHLIGRVLYETFSSHDFDRFWQQYIRDQGRSDLRLWAHPDYTKPGLEVTVHGAWSPQVASMAIRESQLGTHVLVEAAFAPECRAIGAPAMLTIAYTFTADGAIEIDLQWFDKPACRLPEAYWLSMQPICSAEQGTWAVHKLGSSIDPMRVVRGGGRALHGCNPGVTYRDAAVSLAIESLDAVLVAPGRPALLDFHDQLPDMRGGVHFNLYNNVWGTNFPMWFADDARFRFVLRARAAPGLPE